MSPWATLPSHAPVLVNAERRINLAHRLVDGRPLCGSSEPMVHGVVVQCQAKRILPCPPCWYGRQP